MRNAMPIYIVLALFAAVLGTMRLLGHVSQFFQAIAHVYDGALLGIGFYVGLKEGHWSWRLNAYFYIGLILALIEVAAFLMFRR